jgi:histidyl-tRNA synthetase
VGFSATLIALEELGLLGDVAAPPVEVYVLAADEAGRDEAFALAGELRAAGVSALYDCEDRGFKSQLKTAAAGGHPLVAILGTEELERGTVQLKDMRAREQVEVARGELTRAALRALGREPAGAGSAPCPP